MGEREKNKGRKKSRGDKHMTGREKGRNIDDNKDERRGGGGDGRWEEVEGREIRGGRGGQEEDGEREESRKIHPRRRKEKWE